MMGQLVFGGSPVAISHHSQNLKAWIIYLARFGYAAKGRLYGGVGLLALLQALDFSAGDTVDSSGVVESLAGQPYGRLMLVILAISLMVYVLWRFIEAVVDPEHGRSRDVKGIARRRLCLQWAGVCRCGFERCKNCHVSIVRRWQNGAGVGANGDAATVWALAGGRWRIVFLWGGLFLLL
jgi:hypothetical protein